MKNNHISKIIGTVLLTVFLGACTDILDEQPRSIFVPGFFKTEAGVMGGLTSMYAHLRYMYGNAYMYNATETGTDEATYGQQADGNFKDMDLSGIGSVLPSSFNSNGFWTNTFPNINTASGIIENAMEVGTISPALVAEARFFRAFDYFLLVQTYGGVPLDLGAGELKFNTSASRFSVRNTVPEVYTKAIFPDLLKAVADLPATGRVTGGATKTLARLYLAKAYLTYGWWLENPKSIPTYPACERTDPDGHNAAWYFQQAYDVATAGIADPGPFALQPTFYDLNVGKNDRNKEELLYADHTEASELYNGASLTYGSGGGADNFAIWMMTWNYTVLKVGTVNLVQREAEQHLGRPWVRMAPPIGVFTNTFADKTNDSRYDATFTTVYRGNWPKAYVAPNVPPATLVNANGLSIVPGDAVLSFLNEDDPAIVYGTTATTGGSVGAGVLPGRADFVVGPSGISRYIYPGLWKLGVYRTDGGNSLGQPNAGSTRPYFIAKFSELYFVAAEAAVKGASVAVGKSAKDLINVIRARAGKWSFDNNGNKVKVADNSAAMIAATPAAIDIDYILAERSREYYGEGYRWYDLVRTQKWAEKAGTYQICGTAVGAHTPVTVTRTIPATYYLRPIPQSQLNGMEMTPEQLATYQNPGY